MNALEVKVIKGILGGMICFGVAGLIAETQILSLALRLQKVEKNLETTNEVAMELSKTVAETLRNEEDDKEDAE